MKKSKKKVLTARQREQHQQVYGYLHAHCTSEETACPAYKIGEALGISSESTIRAIMAQLIRTYGLPVASSHKGFYLTKDAGAIQATVSNVEGRIVQMRQRINGLNLAKKRLMDRSFEWPMDITKLQIKL